MGFKTLVAQYCYVPCKIKYATRLIVAGVASRSHSAWEHALTREPNGIPGWQAMKLWWRKHKAGGGMST